MTFEAAWSFCGIIEWGNVLLGYPGTFFLLGGCGVVLDELHRHMRWGVVVGTAQAQATSGPLI